MDNGINDQIGKVLNISKYIDINMQKELYELYGAIVGDGTYYLDRGKYPHMTFCNFNENLANKIKNLCEEIAKKKIKLSSRKRKTGVEYSFSAPVDVVKRLVINFLNNRSKSTSEIHRFLIRKGIKINDKSLRKHLNKLHKFGLLNKKNSITRHNELGQFEKSECIWILKIKLMEEQIMNYPYGVIKCNN